MTATASFQGVPVLKPGIWRKKAPEVVLSTGCTAVPSRIHPLPFHRQLPSRDRVEVHCWPSQ
jgi:hypothetical protein